MVLVIKHQGFDFQSNENAILICSTRWYHFILLKI